MNPWVEEGKTNKRTGDADADIIRPDSLIVIIQTLLRTLTPTDREDNGPARASPHHQDLIVLMATKRLRYNRSVKM